MSHRGVAMRRHEVRSRVGEQVCALRRGRENLTSGESAAPAVAGYVADMTAQLESMATAAHLDLLAYFLAMAHAEAEAASQVGIGAAGEPAPSR
jgi:hypothetical protein